MSRTFIIYMLGYLVLAAGVAYGIYALGLDTSWIIAAVLILMGIGIIASTSKSRSR